ncbi:MAG: hypothetical protein JWO51_3847 [Rhodospirillales bacterium]|nr:hypothetical protein [Rhodospirillales bacterium]
MRRQSAGRVARAAVSGLVALSVGGCSTIGGWFSANTDSADVQKIQTRYLGSIAADEPSAVGAGDSILRQNGNAADAAAAIALMLTVSLPSRAGLMGGGVCLVREADSAAVDAIQFLPQPVPGSNVEIPGMVRGLAALQARYGKLDWRQVVVGVERMAAKGVPVSAQLTADAAAAGVTLPPGAEQAEPAVAGVFSQLRLNGASDFYTGDVARQLIAGGLPAQALASYAPAWRPAMQVPSNHDTIYFAPIAGGRVAAGAYSTLMADESAAADPAARFRIARAGAAAAFAKAMGGTTLPADQPSASTGFVVSDASGRVVSCALSMGALFGTHQRLPAPAIYAAAPIAGNPVAQLGLVPAIAYNANSSQVLGAFAGSGGTSAPGDLAAIAFSTLRMSQGAVVSVTAMRRPEDTGPSAVPDRVTVLNCPDGLVRNPKSCAIAKDPRGWGFSQTVDLVK